MRDLTHTVRLLLLSLVPVVACSSTTTNNGLQENDGGGAGEASAADDESALSVGGASGTAGASTTAAGGTDAGDTNDSGGAASNGDSGGAGGDHDGGAGGSADGTGGISTEGTGGVDGTGGSDGAGASGGADGSGGSAGGAGGNSTGGSGGDGTGGSGGSSTGGSGGDGTGGAGGSSGGTGGASFGGGSFGGSAGGISETATTSISTSTTGVSCPVGGACTSECPCSTGEGACTGDAECEDGLVCTSAAVAKLGFTGGSKSCMPAHCDNDEVDDELGESSQDCGGECGCRATYEDIHFTDVPSNYSSVSLSDMSGDGTTLVGFAYDVGTFPVVVSPSGSVTFLEAFGAHGSADYVNDDGSIIAGYLQCDDPPDCTDTSVAPVRWAGSGSAPVEYPFSDTVSGISASGNVVVYTDWAANPDLAHRLVMSTGSNTSNPGLNSAYGISGDGTVVVGKVEGSGNFRVWYTQTGEVWTPPYPSDWVGASILGMSTDGSVFVGGALMGVDQDYLPFISQDRSLELVDIVDDRLTNVGPEDMSADGSRFVGYAYNEETSGSEGVFWDEAGGLRTLYEELTARGLELPVDVTAIGPADFISSNGRIIVGARDSGGMLPFWRVVLDD